MRVYCLAMVAVLTLAAAAFAGDDPSIKGKLRADIHEAMATHVADSMVDSVYVIYDGTEGKLLRLKFGELHSGIVKKAEFYVSCADFSDAAGRQYDLDFLVGGIGDELRVLEGVVHKVDGVKRKYELESAGP